MNKETEVIKGITIDAMLIIGKYFETNNDYINVMKLSKKYHDLAKMYHYNPIGDPSLFKKMETQYFYRPGDVLRKKEGMVQYHYLYDTSKSNGLFDSYILKNVDLLEEWSNKKCDEVLYDSEYDGNKGSIFREKILNHEHLYFIIIDKDDNVFGHYHDKNINRACSKMYDDNMFMFTLNNNDRSEIQHFQNKTRTTFTYIYNDDDYYYCDYDIKLTNSAKDWNTNNGCYIVNHLGECSSCVNGSNCERGFNGIGFNSLINYVMGRFTAERLIVIKME